MVPVLCALLVAASAVPHALELYEQHRDDLVLVELEQPGDQPAEESRLLLRSAERAKEEADDPLALQLASLAQQRDPSQPKSAELLARWALDARDLGRADRFVKLWLALAPGNDDAKQLLERVKQLRGGGRSGGAKRAAAPIHWELYGPRGASTTTSPITSTSTTGNATGTASTITSTSTTAPAVRAAGVTLYGTTWCPPCTKARAYLAKKTVAFVEKDVEKDPRADAELRAKEIAAGLPHAGVPVLDVRGTLVVGYSPAMIDAALARGTK
jgi:glutaredoxin